MKINDINNEIDFEDGGEPAIYWWEDMRPREVRELLINVYNRGFLAKTELLSRELSESRAEVERLRAALSEIDRLSSRGGCDYWSQCRVREIASEALNQGATRAKRALEKP